jgi:TatD DNase family protein
MSSLNWSPDEDVVKVLGCNSPGASMLVDSHCHIDFPELAADLDAVRIGAHGCERSRAVRFVYPSRCRIFRASKKIVGERPQIYGSVGVHPDYEGLDVSCDELVKLAARPKIIAVG